MQNNILTEKEIKELLDDEDELDNYQINDIKEVFIDVVNPDKYIELDSNFLAFERVTRTLNRNLKMILIYGSPGTGKSMFLSRLHNELLANAKYSILIASPILDDVQFIKIISFEIFRQSTLLQTPQDFNSLINSFKSESEYLDRIRPILLLDEAQLYPNSTIEKIRILADTLKLRVVFVVHQLKEEDIFSQEHFKSRIWEKIELKNASLNELRIYIQKKLMSASALSLANQFSKRIVRRIYKITHGNYRVTNNLLYSYFNNYPQLYTSSSLSSTKLKIRIKEIEITAINIGLLKPDINNSFDCQDLSVATEVWKLWKQKTLLKYSIIIVIPTIIYIGIQIGLSFLHSKKSHKINSEIINELDKSDNLSDEFIFQSLETKNNFKVPKYKPIIETQPQQNNFETTAEELSLFNDEVVVQKEQKETKTNKHVQEVKTESPKSVKSLFANLNLPTRPLLENLNIPEIYFHNPIFFKPSLEIFLLLSKIYLLLIPIFLSMNHLY